KLVVERLDHHRGRVLVVEMDGHLGERPVEQLAIFGRERPARRELLAQVGDRLLEMLARGHATLRNGQPDQRPGCGPLTIVRSMQKRAPSTPPHVPGPTVPRSRTLPGASCAAADPPVDEAESCRGLAPIVTARRPWADRFRR